MCVKEEWEKILKGLDFFAPYSPEVKDFLIDLWGHRGKEEKEE